ncbi:chromosome partitioning protein ParA [Pseudoalteromonas porphyrae]|uniref:Chromosome partitioning protein ParA n=1 Tax=Pseudoalteromonas porphyrae TaxID=187330 RepID=A0A0N1ESY4_9GAMM|nr:DUF1365 domain-containing protein [Pseudoalteromonas porphyrae]KPH62463.1 chromosome partitioning protein ParA [Pseudoalteromonas porphyrae]KPH95888.1 chromosome partitioning protein ParA [Pseudoalteromonas porphyrae]
MTSAVYIGDIKHRRFAVKSHYFKHPIYMMWVDLIDPESLNNIHKGLGTKGFKALKFNQADYLNQDENIHETISDRAFKKIAELGVSDIFENVYMLGQLRCFGLYFSPVNFFFYQSKSGDFTHMVAEVSNTPWNERHYYLVPIEKKVNFKKVFSVSPFMDLDMNYHWNTRFKNDNAMIHIENKKDGTVLFDATLRLKRQSLNNESVSALLKQFPAMTWSIFKGIYVHAFKLFCKRVPFIGHSGKGS